MKKTQLKRFERAAYKSGYLDKDGYFFQSDADFWRGVRGLTENELNKIKSDCVSQRSISGVASR